MGVPTMSSRALRAEVERADRERGSEVRRLEERRVGADRLEQRIDPAVRRRLDALRRGDG
jgi:predicted RNA-binding protein with PIN domain